MEVLTKYNWVFFLEDEDYYHVAYCDLLKYNDVIVNYGFKPKANVLKIIHSLHNSGKISRYLELPFKSIWFNTYGRFNFDNGKPICFVFDARLIKIEHGRNYVQYLRNHYSNAKFVCYYQDILKTWNKESMPDKIRHFFDIIITFDIEESKKYEMLYHPTVYSDFKVTTGELLDESDIYFMGMAKSRFPQILWYYKKLTSLGLKCEFYISGVKCEDQVLSRGLHYIERMGYIENLKHILNCKCILEIVQEGASGFTLRTWEAINFNKCLLTNNCSLKLSEFFDERYILFEDDIERWNKDYFNNSFCKNNSLKDRIRPYNLMKFIEDNLSSH